ncbi:hypothetical protein [Bdellovibrio sp. NC01]|uniref:c-type cytochrome n=1 Tax=Bdellovibrio sp. NC01 TaxID=2220073 RepID=UPI0011593A28|nr:hypothetical protein [Bdellovibrio sp. NC01]QDK39017.1 hypothetical protein DOE51_16200 [Bdellovibrio sp. NC01]
MKHSKVYKLLTAVSFCALLSGCLETPWDSLEFNRYREKNGEQKNLGQVRFVYDSLNSLSLNGLMNTNILPLKVYGTALLLADAQDTQQKIDGKNLPKTMQKFGFIRAQGIANWRDDLAVRPELTGEKTFGLVRQNIEVNIVGRRMGLEVANITCAACHGGVTYDAQGMPTRNVWLGAPNSSLNFDGFLGGIYKGLKIAANNPDLFLAKLKEAYPNIDALEYKTISKDLLPIIKKELAKMEAKSGKVLPFPNGGAGITNGVGAFKRDAKLKKDAFVYDPHEAGFVSIPDISYRGFRSSLTYDGAYGVKNTERFRNIERNEAMNPSWGSKLAELASFFTFSAMGNTMGNAEKAVPRVKEIFSVLQYNKPPAYPGVIDSEAALRGSQVFAKSCSQCHGVYSDGLNPQLLSFPNKFMKSEAIGTDPLRWQNVDQAIKDYSDKTAIGKYVDAGHSMGGYVAPILSGLWYTAPYLHNGSVPTLWQLMNPELRPVKFELGGHALDMQLVGIKGELNEDGKYVYPQDYQPWSLPTEYDTTQPGRSNKGHEKPFAGLSQDQKKDLLEYLKLL